MDNPEVMDNREIVVIERKKPVPNKSESSIFEKVAFLMGGKTLHNKTLSLCVKGKFVQVKIDSEGNPKEINTPNE